MRFQESIYLVNSPWASLWPMETVAMLGGGEPKPSPCSSQRPSGQPPARSFHEGPMSPQGPERQFASERWQEVVCSSGGFLFYVNFSVHFPWKWLIFGAAFWPNLLTERLDPPEGRFPLGDPRGECRLPPAQAIGYCVYSGDREQMSLKIGVWFMSSY